MTQRWNEVNQVPLSDWLLPSQTANDKERLQAMGNIVVPIQAQEASRILSCMHQLFE